MGMALLLTARLVTQPRRAIDRAHDRNDLQIGRVPLGFADFLTCAGFPCIAWSGSRGPGFSGLSSADPLAARSSCCDAPEPSSRFSGVYGQRGPTTYSDVLRLALHAVSA